MTNCLLGKANDVWARFLPKGLNRRLLNFIYVVVRSVPKAITRVNHQADMVDTAPRARTIPAEEDRITGLAIRIGVFPSHTQITSATTLAPSNRTKSRGGK
jgi:hypothetical protein